MVKSSDDKPKSDFLGTCIATSFTKEIIFSKEDLIEFLIDYKIS